MEIFLFINDIWDAIFKDEWEDQISALHGLKIRELIVFVAKYGTWVLNTVNTSEKTD
jgi:hypothetical protein